MRDKIPLPWPPPSSNRAPPPPPNGFVPGCPAIYSNSQRITLQLRHELPTEVDLAATSFKAAVALAPCEALAIAGELLTEAAAQLKPKGWTSPHLAEVLPLMHGGAGRVATGVRSAGTGLSHDVGRDIGHADTGF